MAADFGDSTRLFVTAGDPNINNIPTKGKKKGKNERGVISVFKTHPNRRDLSDPAWNDLTAQLMYPAGTQKRCKARRTNDGAAAAAGAGASEEDAASAVAACEIAMSGPPIPPGGSPGSAADLEQHMLMQEGEERRRRLREVQARPQTLRAEDHPVFGGVVPWRMNEISQLRYQDGMANSVLNMTNGAAPYALPAGLQGLGTSFPAPPATAALEAPTATYQLHGPVCIAGQLWNDPLLQFGVAVTYEASNRTPYAAINYAPTPNPSQVQYQPAGRADPYALYQGATWVAPHLPRSDAAPVPSEVLCQLDAGAAKGIGGQRFHVLCRLLANDCVTELLIGHCWPRRPTKCEDGKLHSLHLLSPRTWDAGVLPADVAEYDACSSSSGGGDDDDDDCEAVEPQEMEVLRQLRIDMAAHTAAAYASLCA